jgi:REP-associated tyrosine transposase
MTKNLNLPNRKSIRLSNHNYTYAGAYFVTICTRSRKCILGQIIDHVMVPNELGKIVDSFWQKIPYYFSNVRLDEHVVMPNHIHGIIIIDESIHTFTIPQPSLQFRWEG